MTTLLPALTNLRFNESGGLAVELPFKEAGNKWASHQRAQNLALRNLESKKVLGMQGEDGPLALFPLAKLACLATRSGGTLRIKQCHLHPGHRRQLQIWAPLLSASRPPEEMGRWPGLSATTAQAATLSPTGPSN